MNDRPIDGARPSRHASLRSTAILGAPGRVPFSASCRPKRCAESASTQSGDQPPDVTPQAYLSVISTPPKYVCPATSAAHFDAIPVLPPPTDRPAAQHADLNLACAVTKRAAVFSDWLTTAAARTRTRHNSANSSAPATCYTMTAVYQVYDWNWPANCRGGLITNPPVTLIALGDESRRSSAHSQPRMQTSTRARTARWCCTPRSTASLSSIRATTTWWPGTPYTWRTSALTRTCWRCTGQAIGQGRASLPALRNGETLGVAGGAARSWSRRVTREASWTRDPPRTGGERRADRARNSPVLPFTNSDPLMLPALPAAVIIHTSRQ